MFSSSAELLLNSTQLTWSFWINAARQALSMIIDNKQAILRIIGDALAHEKHTVPLTALDHFLCPSMRAPQA